MEKLWEKLKNPEAEYRPHPFWSWNDKLDEELCRFEIDEMKKSGAGGFFMHARTGLSTEYLSEEWMKVTEACIQYAEENGMEAWGYDEDGWPSGFAGGEVQKSDPETIITWIECRESGDVREGEELLINFSDGERKTDIGEKCIVLCKNPGYVDLLNPASTEQFIRITHESYKQQLPEKAFKKLRGFFTDEPQYKREKIPYSVIIEGEFYKTYGYSIRENLPALFCNLPGAEKIRYDYYHLVSSLFTENFTKRLYRWHTEHNMGFTGHFLHEESLLCQMQGTAGVMPHYEYMTMPGMDWLGRSIGSPIVPKQVSSVAAQTGKKQILSETFALCGWNVSFEELKWMAHWQFVNGITMICQHLEAYTLRGSRKRDYPPSLFYQQPYWDIYKKINDYFGRIGQLFSETKEVVKIGVLHPIRSAWTVYTGEETEKLRKLEESLTEISCTLSGMHLPYHYIDEGILARKGKVSGEGRLQVGCCEYEMIVLPVLYSMDRSTLDFLKQFVQAGGLLCSADGLSETKVAGEEETCAADELNGMICRFDEQNLPEDIRSRNNSFIRIMDEQGREIPDIHVMCREEEGVRYYFLANLSKEKKCTAQIRIKDIDTVEIWDMWEYQKKNPELCRQEENVSFLLHMDEMEAVVLCCSRKQEIIKVADELEIKKADINSLTLDCAQYCIDDGEWMPEKPVIRIMKELLSARRNASVKLKFRFDIQAEPEKLGPVYLVLESCENYSVTINQKKFLFKDEGFWKDSAFRKAEITDRLFEGDNEIILETQFYQNEKVYDVLFNENVLETEKNKLTLDTELESIYICGNFGVFHRGSIIKTEHHAYTAAEGFYIGEKPCRVKKGDITCQGYTFFAGNMELAEKIQIEEKGEKRYILRFDHKPNCAVLTIKVNGSVVRTFAGGTLDTDITEYLKEGENELEYCFGGTNRNLLGPHHFIGGESHSVGPDTFGDEGGWTEPADLQGKNIWTDSYCFVEFGF